jgi:hypothetical protein
MDGVYVRTDVASEYSADWKTYYTHHRNKYGPHYVCVDVGSDYSAV